MRVLVLGGTGMLGHKLVQALQSDFDVWTTTKCDFAQLELYEIFEKAKTLTGIDVASINSLEDAIKNVRPDVVINAIGIIKQLPLSRNVIQTLMINSIFPHRLAELSESFNFKLITISTDCVFDGQKGSYVEDDAPNALDLYGTSKRLGEIDSTNCLTLRTSIIGRELKTSHSLLEWFLSNRGKAVDGYTHAIYSGLPTIVLADIIKRLILSHPEIQGLFHVSSTPINKYQLLELVKTKLNLNIEIRQNSEFKIDRSLNSDRFRKLTGIVPPDWDKMIEQVALDPTPYEEWRANEPA